MGRRPTISPKEIFMLFDIIASFLISALAGMGVGGGGLLVIYLTLLGDSEQLKAQGINLIFFLCASFAALCVNLKQRRLDFRQILLLSAVGSVFAVLGALLAANIETAILRKIFGGLLILSGMGAFLKKQTHEREEPNDKNR